MTQQPDNNKTELAKSIKAENAENCLLWAKQKLWVLTDRLSEGKGPACNLPQWCMAACENSSSSKEERCYSDVQKRVLFFWRLSPEYLVSVTHAVVQFNFNLVYLYGADSERMVSQGDLLNKKQIKYTHFNPHI